MYNLILCIQKKMLFKCKKKYFIASATSISVVRYIGYKRKKEESKKSVLAYNIRNGYY